MHLAESECVLIKHERYIELVELYNVKGHHHKGVRIGHVGVCVCVCVCVRVCVCVMCVCV